MQDATEPSRTGRGDAASGRPPTRRRSRWLRRFLITVASIVATLVLTVLAVLHGCEWNGRRIVSEDWVRTATAADATSDPAGFYQRFWWIDAERPERFYALGNFGQYVYVAPDADAVIVRNGSDWGVDNDEWLSTFRAIADRMVGAR